VVHPMALLGAALGVAALVVALWPAPRRPHPGPPRPTAADADELGE
jgi:hypothetical protein